MSGLDLSIQKSPTQLRLGWRRITANFTFSLIHRDLFPNAVSSYTLDHDIVWMHLVYGCYEIRGYLLVKYYFRYALYHHLTFNIIFPLCRCYTWAFSSRKLMFVLYVHFENKRVPAWEPQDCYNIFVWKSTSAATRLRAPSASLLRFFFFFFLSVTCCETTTVARLSQGSAYASVRSGLQPSNPNCVLWVFCSQCMMPTVI